MDNIRKLNWVMGQNLIDLSGSTDEELAKFMNLSMGRLAGCLNSFKDTATQMTIGDIVDIMQADNDEEIKQIVTKRLGREATDEDAYALTEAFIALGSVFDEDDP